MHSKWGILILKYFRLDEKYILPFISGRISKILLRSWRNFKYNLTRYIDNTISEKKTLINLSIISQNYHEKLFIILVNIKNLSTI